MGNFKTYLVSMFAVSALRNQDTKMEKLDAVDPHMAELNDVGFVEKIVDVLDLNTSPIDTAADAVVEEASGAKQEEGRFWRRRRRTRRRRRDRRRTRRRRVSVQYQGNLVPKWGSPTACTCKKVKLQGSYSPGGLVHCKQCTDVYKSKDEDSCPHGWKIFSPRSATDWKTVTDSISLNTVQAPQLIFDVTRPANGCGGCQHYAMKSGVSQQSSWKTLDGTPWFLRSSKYGEPNGDYHANCYLALGGVGNEKPNDITFNDGNCLYHSNSYLCQEVSCKLKPGRIVGKWVHKFQVYGTRELTWTWGTEFNSAISHTRSWSREVTTSIEVSAGVEFEGFGASTTASESYTRTSGGEYSEERGEAISNGKEETISTEGIDQSKHVWVWYEKVYNACGGTEVMSATTTKKWTVTSSKKREPCCEPGYDIQGIEAMCEVGHYMFDVNGPWPQHCNPNGECADRIPNCKTNFLNRCGTGDQYVDRNCRLTCGICSKTAPAQGYSNIGSGHCVDSVNRRPPHCYSVEVSTENACQELCTNIGTCAAYEWGQIGWGKVLCQLIYPKGLQSCPAGFTANKVGNGGNDITKVHHKTGGTCHKKKAR